MRASNKEKKKIVRVAVFVTRESFGVCTELCHATKHKHAGQSLSSSGVD